MLIRDINRSDAVHFELILSWGWMRGREVGPWGRVGRGVQGEGSGGRILDEERRDYDKII